MVRGNNTEIKQVDCGRQEHWSNLKISTMVKENQIKYVKINGKLQYGQKLECIIFLEKWIAIRL